VNAVAAGVSEAGGGVLILTGLATPLATAALTGTMLTAIDRVHRSNGPWNSDGGYEYNVALIAALLTLVETGPGALSLGEALGVERSGTRWALAALAGGAAGAVGVRMLTTAEHAQAPERSEPEYQRAAA
jgi:putative oxidoreductase